MTFSDHFNQIWPTRIDLNFNRPIDNFFTLKVALKFNLTSAPQGYPAWSLGTKSDLLGHLILDFIDRGFDFGELLRRLVGRRNFIGN